jgi:hypothetical protein
MGAWCNPERLQAGGTVLDLVLKLFGISIAIGLSFAWMIGLGMAFGVSNAFKHTAVACHLGRAVIRDGPDIVMTIGAVAGLLMLIGAGVDTFKTGAAPKLIDGRGWLFATSLVWVAMTTATILGLIPFWLGCRLLRAILAL